MKKLFIVRHAKSSWDFPELDDFDRPLNNRGKKNAPEMGNRLAERQIKPDMVISSPAKRAHTTAKRFMEGLEISKKNIYLEPAFYHGSTYDILDVLKKTDQNVQTLMIFGHNPMLTDLANILAVTDIFNIPTCGVVEIDFDIENWAELDRGKGKLISFDFPKNDSSH